MRLGFVGTGSMGAPIARNLLRAGHQVAVYNRTRNRAEALAADGARVVDHPAEAARDAEAVITMLADDRATANVVFGHQGLLDSLGQGAAHISMSTISVAFAGRLNQVHSDRGQVYISAPVFGRPEAAAAAKLWVVTAGPAREVERFRPVFETSARGLSWVGEEAPKANVVKVAGNFLIAAMLEALGESFALARKSGIQAQEFLNIINDALFNSPLYANYGKRIAEQAFEPAGFKLRLGLKDARLVLEAAENAAVPLPLASLVRDHLVNAIAQGEGDADWSAVTTVSARAAGLDGQNR